MEARTATAAAVPSKAAAGSTFAVAAAGPPATIPAFLGPRTVAALAHESTADIQLAPESVKRELPRILQQIVSPAGGTAAQEAVVRRHFAIHAQLSHPLGYAVGSAQIASLLSCLYLLRRPLFPTVEVVPVQVVFDPARLTAAMEVVGTMRMRWLGMKVPVLAQFFVELAPRRGERGSSPDSLVISWWSEHYSIRTLALLLPGPLAALADGGCRRAVAAGSERLLRLLARLGVAQWVQARGI